MQSAAASATLTQRSHSILGPVGLLAPAARALDPQPGTQGSSHQSRLGGSAEGILDVLKGARSGGKKLVFTLHHTSPPSALLRELCDLADAVMVHSPASRIELILNGCELSKIHVVTPGVVQKELPPQRRTSQGSRFPDVALRQKLGLGAFSKIIATPGFVSRRKGILDVINSLASIRNILDVHYLVLGTADAEDSESAGYLKECKALVRQHRLERQVTFVDRFLPLKN